MTSAPFVIDVRGTPAPQGSKRAFAIKAGGQYTGRVAVVEQQHDRVRTWRADVMAAATQAMTTHYLATGDYFPIDDPVAVMMIFGLQRPRAHYGTGRNAAILRPAAPAWPGRKPDLDKLIRATADALTDVGVWTDDGQVVSLIAAKHWAGAQSEPGRYPPPVPGAHITITEAT